MRYPDRARTFDDASSDEVTTALGQQRASRGRSLAIVVAGLVVAALAWQVSPASVVLAFVVIAAWTIVWHRRNRGVVHAGFLRWCSDRGLRHVAGQVSPMYPMASTGHADHLPVDAFTDAVGGRVRLTCQVAGRLWSDLPECRITSVSVRRGGDTKSQFVVIDVPVDPSIPEDLAAVPDAFVSEGRFVTWFGASFPFFEAGIATAARTGQRRRAGAHAGADLLLDQHVDEARRRFDRFLAAASSTRGAAST